MNDHMHKWIPWEGEPWFFTCEDENCPRVLDKLATMRRVNATERLSILTIMGLVGLLEHEHPVSFDKYKEELRAYFAELEGTDAD